MPTAIVQPGTRGTTYDCARIGPADWQQPLPPEIAHFASWSIGPTQEDGGKAIPFNVGIWLKRDPERGGHDMMPLLAACDWLRDQGWVIEPRGWLRKFLKKG